LTTNHTPIVGRLNKPATSFSQFHLLRCRTEPAAFQPPGSGSATRAPVSKWRILHQLLIQRGVRWPVNRTAARHAVVRSAPPWVRSSIADFSTLAVKIRSCLLKCACPMVRLHAN